MNEFNIADKRLNDQAGQEIIARYEQGRRVFIPKAGEFFELPSGGDARIIPSCDQWVLGIDDAALRIKPASNPVRGWLLFVAVIIFLAVAAIISISYSASPWAHKWQNPTYIPLLIGGAGGLILSMLGFFFLWIIIRQPVSWPVLFLRHTGQVVQMQGRERVEAAWSDLRPFVERLYTPQGLPIWRLRLIQTDAANKVLKNFSIKVQAERADDCACYYEYLHRYMQGQWQGIPDTLLVHGMRRSLLRQFRNDFGWIFGKQCPWDERPSWLKALMIVLMPLVTFVFWPLGFFVLLGSRLGWVPKFSREDETQASGGTLPLGLAPRIHREPPLAMAEKVLYTAIIVVATAIWSWWSWHYLGLFFGALLSGK